MKNIITKTYNAIVWPIDIASKILATTLFVIAIIPSFIVHPKRWQDALFEQVQQMREISILKKMKGEN